MSRKSKQLGLDVVDTHMGLLDYIIRCVFGDEHKAYEYAAYVFEQKWDAEHVLNDEQKGNVARGVTLYQTGYVPIVWLPKLPTEPREHATFAHEVIHAVYHLFDWANIPISRDTEEVFAHSVAHVINNVLPKLKLPQQDTRGPLAKKGVRKIAKAEHIKRLEGQE